MSNAGTINNDHAFRSIKASCHGLSVSRNALSRFNSFKASLGNERIKANCTKFASNDVAIEIEV